MNIHEFSKKYMIRRLTPEDQDSIYAFFLGNKQYFEYVPPMVNRETALEDMKALPPGKGYEDKYFVGYFSDHLVAILDLIDRYPDENTSFIGLFMMNEKDQGRYYGWNIIQDLCFYLKDHGVKRVRLGVVEANVPALYFWDKCGFKATGIISHQELYDVLVYEKIL